MKNCFVNAPAADSPGSLIPALNHWIASLGGVPIAAPAPPSSNIAQLAQYLWAIAELQPTGGVVPVPPAPDIYINGAALDPATFKLTLSDASAGTPDVVTDLSDLKKVVTADTATVAFLGTGEVGSPLSAIAVIPPTTHSNSWTRADGLKESVDGVDADIAIIQDTIADFIGYNAAGEVVYESKDRPRNYFEIASMTANVGLVVTHGFSFNTGDEKKITVATRIDATGIPTSVSLSNWTANSVTLTSNVTTPAQQIFITRI